VCTVVVSLTPGEPVPLRLLGIRDELASRPWRPPARHWPGSPLVGGIDEQAGGTWLAVHPQVPRVACLLNGRGRPADPARKRSRGDLSLRAAAEGPGFLRDLAADPAALAAYDPFHLICATLDSVTALTWAGSDPLGDRPLASPGARASGPDGKKRDPAGPARPDASRRSALVVPRDASRRTVPAVPQEEIRRPGPVVPQDTGQEMAAVVRDLAPGTHLFTNAGHAYPAGPGDPVGEPKAARFADKFAAAHPSADPALPVAEAWGDWLTLASGDGLDPADPAAIIVRHDLPDGRVYGTTSVTLVALASPGGRPPGAPRGASPGGRPPGTPRGASPGGRPPGPGTPRGAESAVRYDFQPHPGRPDGWYPVDLG
jgi:hypothetical protein